jgi:hypothetical protein
MHSLMHQTQRSVVSHDLLIFGYPSAARRLASDGSIHSLCISIFISDQRRISAVVSLSCSSWLWENVSQLRHRHVISLSSIALRHRRGKKSRTPSIEARVEGTKQQIPKSKVGFLYLIYIPFLCFCFLFFLSLSLPFCCLSN